MHRPCQCACRTAAPPTSYLVARTCSAAQSVWQHLWPQVLLITMHPTIFWPLPLSNERLLAVTQSDLASAVEGTERTSHARSKSYRCTLSRTRDRASRRSRPSTCRPRSSPCPVSTRCARTYLEGLTSCATLTGVMKEGKGHREKGECVRWGNVESPVLCESWVSHTDNEIPTQCDKRLDTRGRGGQQ